MFSETDFSWRLAELEQERQRAAIWHRLAAAHQDGARPKARARSWFPGRGALHVIVGYLRVETERRPVSETMAFSGALMR